MLTDVALNERVMQFFISPHSVVSLPDAEVADDGRSSCASPPEDSMRGSTD